MPLYWDAGAREWRVAYETRIDETLKSGKKVWMVIAADTDVGAHLEAAALRWLEQIGLRGEVVNPDPIGRIYAVLPRGSV